VERGLPDREPTLGTVILCPGQVAHSRSAPAPIVAPRHCSRRVALPTGRVLVHRQVCCSPRSWLGAAAAVLLDALRAANPACGAVRVCSRSS